MKLVPLFGSLAVANQIPLPATHHQADQGHVEQHSWLNGLPSVDAVIGKAGSLFDTAVDNTKKLHEKVVQDLVHITESTDHSTLSIYQVISDNPHTTEFVKYVKEFPDLVSRLNDTDASQTLFVPVNHAFEHIPKDHKPSKDVLESILSYHISPEEYSAKRALSSYTIPTVFKEKWLGDEPQRLRPGLDLHGANINWYSRILKADIKTNNGVIHAVDHVLVPPPMVGVILNLVPSHFSTLLLAYEKTDFVKFIHGVKMVGSTVFAPSNKAFAALGAKANAFLFNTEKGHKYLTALLKYQIVPDVTLYSDHVTDKRDQKAQGHHELPTLLDGATLGVDVKKVWGFIVIRVNGFIDVSVHDAVAKNGVVHEVDRLPLPPRKGQDETEFVESEISIDELKETLEDYL